jgi:hypothetical protein
LGSGYSFVELADIYPLLGDGNKNATEQLEDAEREKKTTKLPNLRTLVWKRFTECDGILLSGFYTLFTDERAEILEVVEIKYSITTYVL